MASVVACFGNPMDVIASATYVKARWNPLSRLHLVRYIRDTARYSDERMKERYFECAIADSARVGIKSPLLRETVY